MKSDEEKIHKAELSTFLETIHPNKIKLLDIQLNNGTHFRHSKQLVPINKAFMEASNHYKYETSIRLLRKAYAVRVSHFIQNLKLSGCAPTIYINTLIMYKTYKRVFLKETI